MSKSVTPSAIEELRPSSGAGFWLLVFFFDVAAADAAKRLAMLAPPGRAQQSPKRLGAALLLAALFAAASAAWSQGPVDGAIRGHITAVCGPLPHLCGASGVHLHLSSTDFAVERDLTTDRDGNFLLLRLPPGEYQLRASSTRGTAITTVDLEGGDFDDLSLALSPSHGDSTATAPIATLASFELQGEDDGLPIESRQWENLAELDSEANEEPSTSQAADSTGEDDQDDPQSTRSATDGAASSGLSYAGLPSTQGSFSLDGLSGDQSFRSGPRGSASGGASSGSSYQQGSVRSFRILPKNFSAQYGMTGGMAVVTRAASTRLHGNAFFLARESAWAATNPFSMATHYNNGLVTSEPVKPEGSMLQFGGSVGLPLSRSGAARTKHRRSRKLHEREPLAMFASLDVLLHDDHIVSSPELATFYSLSPDQIALLSNRGVGTAATNAALNYLDSLTGTTARHAYRVQGTLRFDAEPTVRDHLTAEYAGNRFDSPSGATLGQASDAVVARGTGSLGDSVVHVDAGSARWLHTFSPRFNNEIRGQVARDLDYQTPHAPLPQEPAIGPGGYAPQVSIGPQGFAYGTPSSLSPGAPGGHPAYPDELRYELADTMQLHLGRHLLMIGGDWSRIHDRIDQLSAQEGAFSYASGTTNGKDGGLVDWITDYTYNVHAYPNGGCPTIAPTDNEPHYFCFRSFTQGFGETSTQFVTHDFAGFAEDAMRVRNNLTVTLGLRYDYTLLPKPQTANPLLDADIAAEIAGPIHGATATFPEDRNNFGPRLSAAWSPLTLWGLPRRWSRKKVPMFTMHLGYGLFYGRIPGATIRAALVDTALDTTTTHVRIRPTTITDCPQVTAVNQGFGYPCDYVTAPPAAVAQTTSATVFASNFRVPLVQRGAFSLERSLGRRTTLRASYAMAMATQLPGSTDINISPSQGMVSYILQVANGHPGLHNGQIFEVPLYDARPIANFGAVTALVSNANATYHAFTAEAQVHGLRWAPLRSLELRGSYTFSRSIDYAPQTSATPSQDEQFDPFHNGYDKGLSSQQFPQRFSGDLMYGVHVSSGSKMLRKTLNGWRFSAIGIASSGAPYSYNIFGGSYLTGGRETINGSGGATYLPTIGRNTLRLAPRGTVNLRVSRELSAGHKLHLNVFAEAFNLFNAENISRVETRAFEIGTPATIGNSDATGPTPLVFQDAAQIATEGLTTEVPFGTPSSSTSGASKERQLELGLRLQF